MKEPQNKRVTGKEQYYTPSNTAEHCFNVMLGKVGDDGRTWLEPAGGTGSFIDAMVNGGIPPRKIVSL